MAVVDIPPASAVEPPRRTPDAAKPVMPARPAGAPDPNVSRATTAGQQSAPVRRDDWSTSGSRPTRPKASFGLMRGLHRVLQRSAVWNAVATGLESSRTLYRAFTAAEKAAKSQLFGCRMCGQCALPSTAYACPMTCPKQLRNGPCGGVAPDGSCEVYPGTRCVWLIAYERAEADGHVADLRRLQRPIDQRKWGESSWVNYWRGRDDGLWTEDAQRRGGRLELPMLPAATAQRSQATAAR